jgi:hypothetical protein
MRGADPERYVAYIHYSSRPEPPQVPPRAINQFAGGTGPLGVYAYQEDARQQTFGHGRPYAFVLEPTVPVLHTHRYTQHQLDSDLPRLSETLDISRALWLWDKLVARREARNAEMPFAKLWYVLGHLTRSSDPEDAPPLHQSACADPALARDLLVTLGYEVISDRYGMMYSGEPEQAVFLTNRSFRVVEERSHDMARREYVRNPAWATEAVARSWELMEDTIVPAWRPQLDSVKISAHDRVSGGVHEYGCGKYGCVFPTYEPSVVLKVTSDSTEAEFAALLANTLVRPICVEYYAAIALDMKRSGRPVHLLWRESADKVGLLKEVLWPQAVALINAQHGAAQKAFFALQGMAIKDMPGRPHEVMRRALSLWLESCEVMARQTQVPQLRELGDGLVEVYTRQRIFFGDIHAGNLGIAHRADGGHWVVTDPGHVAVVDLDT